MSHQGALGVSSITPPQVHAHRRSKRQARGGAALVHRRCHPPQTNNHHTLFGWMKMTTLTGKVAGPSTVMYLWEVKAAQSVWERSAKAPKTNSWKGTGEELLKKLEPSSKQRKEGCLRAMCRFMCHAVQRCSWMLGNSPV